MVTVLVVVVVVVVVVVLVLVVAIMVVVVVMIVVMVMMVAGEAFPAAALAPRVTPQRLTLIIAYRPLIFASGSRHTL